MLKVQATFCGSDTTSTSARSLTSSARTRLSLSAALSPASLRSRSADRPMGGAGRSFHSASIGLLSTATSSAPALAQALRSLSAPSAGVQPGIVAELGAALEILLEPLVGRVVDQMLDGKDLRIGLRRRLHGVAAVDEQHRALGQHDRNAGRAGEAGEPGEALFARRQIFVLLAVGARHHEAVEPAALEFGAQGRDARGAAARSLRIRRRSGTWLRT